MSESEKFHPYLLSERLVYWQDGKAHVVKKAYLEDYLQANAPKLAPGEAERVRAQVEAQRLDYEAQRG